MKLNKSHQNKSIPDHNAMVSKWRLSQREMKEYVIHNIPLVYNSMSFKSGSSGY